MKKYAVLSTYPGHRSSANVGDQLIEIALKKLVRKEKSGTEFLTFFREDSLAASLSEINRTSAVLLPAFPIRDAVPMYPGVYRLVEDLHAIRVPLIPVGANWNVYPGDDFSRQSVKYSSATTAFLRHVASGVEYVSCREYHLQDVLKKHGITNTLMTGDPAWYDPDFLGKPFHRPRKIESLVFSPPLSAFFGRQGLRLLDMLAQAFPHAKRYCAFHLTDAATSPFDNKAPTLDASMRPDVAQKNALIRSHAAKLGFEILDLAGHVDKLDFYRRCDVHVGYECHAHLGFFRQRRPSVLIAEDARGVGFNYTLGAGGFDGFKRAKAVRIPPPGEGGTSGYCVSREEYAVAPAREDLAPLVRRYLEEELQSGFRRYLGVADFIDETYAKVMSPFLRALP